MNWLTSWPITQRSLILSVSSVAGVQTGLASHGATATMAGEAGLFYSTTGRAVRQSWGAAAVADTPSKHARAAASDPKMRFGTDVFVNKYTTWRQLDGGDRRRPEVACYYTAVSRESDRHTSLQQP